MSIEVCPLANSNGNTLCAHRCTVTTDLRSVCGRSFLAKRAWDCQERLSTPAWHRCYKRKTAVHARKAADETDDAKAAGEWAALAYEDKDEEQVAADLQQKLNEICNEGLKLMLKDSSARQLEEYKDKVSAVGANFSKEQDMQGATFAYVLYKMTEHTQVEELHNLEGVYLAACLKMFGLLEDSGWALNKEGEDDTEMPQDENPLPNVPTLGSYSGII
ncbi:hypothetical protein ABBQ38_013801 [Trebouxia sp. C0009 RCD-2024]